MGEQDTNNHGYAARRGERDRRQCAVVSGFFVLCVAACAGNPLALPLDQRFDGPPTRPPEQTLATGWKHVTVGGPALWMTSAGEGNVSFEQNGLGFVSVQTRNGETRSPAPLIIDVGLRSFTDAGAQLGEVVDGKVAAGHFPAKIREGACALQGESGRCWALLVEIPGTRALVVAGVKDSAPDDAKLAVINAIRAISGP